MKFELKAHGAEQLEARLMRLVARAETDAALRSAAESIGSEAAARLSDIADVSVVREQNADSVRYRIGSDSRDAVDREDGTRITRAQPWLGPAFGSAAPKLSALLGHAFRITRA